MNMIFSSFISTFLTMLIIDGVWLSTMSKRFYAFHLKSLMAPSPDFVPAAIFYLIYAIGVTAFIVLPAVRNGDSLLRVFLFGALFGLVCYATYDLTNQATLRGWPVIVTLVDLLWGTLCTGTVGIVAVLIARRFI